VLKRLTFENFEIAHYLKVASTNDFLEFQDDLLLSDRLVIWADSQTKGKGRRGRQWSAPAGNLCCSLYLDVSQFQAPLYELSFLTAVAVYDAIIELYPILESDLKLKWPNDLLLDRKKCGGILLEAVDLPMVSNFMVIGIGLNLHHFFAAGDYPTTALKEYLPIEKCDPFEVLTHILKHFSRLLLVWEERGFDAILHRWQRAMIHQKGDSISIEIGAHREQVHFEHIAADGALVYTHEGGIKKHMAGDVILK
jgi:BirA family biotin operon repressor/biotin-[acetyl-CoA-carboxylase] ligase